MYSPDNLFNVLYILLTEDDAYKLESEETLLEYINYTYGNHIISEMQDAYNENIAM